MKLRLAWLSYQEVSLNVHGTESVHRILFCQIKL